VAALGDLSHVISELLFLSISPRFRNRCINMLIRLYRVRDIDYSGRHFRLIKRGAHPSNLFGA